MAITATPEILPPKAKPGWKKQVTGDLFDDHRLDVLSHLLDDFIRIPGTPIRFGLDGIIGFIPGIGDVLGGLASTIIIVAAWVRGVPGITLARMVLNVVVETVVGSVPVLGNLFDIGWRANRRNYALLTGSLASPAEARRHSARSWLLFAVVAMAILPLLLIPELLLGYVLLHLKAWLH